MSKVKKITAHEILDSRGVPTIRGILTMDTGQQVVSEVSSGKSLSKYEPKELRDNDMSRYEGQGVQKAVSYINNLIAPKLTGADVERVFDVDTWLKSADSTDDSSKLGANTMLIVSQLFMKAAAMSTGVPLFQYIQHMYQIRTKKQIPIARMPAPVVNIINGGTHGSSTLNFQEFHVIPSTSLNFKDALEKAHEVYRATEKVLEYRNVGTFVSQQGGFAPHLMTNIDGLEVIKEAIVKEKLRIGVDVFLGLDCAAGTYYKGNKYAIKDAQQPLDPKEYIAYLKKISADYNILLLEDPLYEDSFNDWKEFNKVISDTTYLTGDDLIAGSKDRLAKVLKEKLCSTLVIKSNQYSTLTQLFDAVATIKDKGVKLVISQRFGETTDDFIADLAVGIQADFVKFGSPNRGERVVKYNRLLEIFQEISPA